MKEAWAHFCVRFFVLSLFMVLLCLPLARQGMFVDGVWYAAIAKNMATHLGSIWDPALSKSMFSHFREHPPFAIFLQSFFFKAFGTHFWVERLYCFVVALLQIGLVYAIWRREKTLINERMALLVFLWLMIPLNIGMHKNNLLEATQTVFTTLAVFLLLSRFALVKGRHLAVYFLAGVSMLLGFLSNGPTAMFPLAVPFLYALCTKRQLKRVAFVRSIELVLVTAIVFSSFFYLFPEALENIRGYFHVQLMAAITGNRDLSFTGLRHFYIVYIFIKDYYIVSLIVLAMIALDANKQGIPFKDNFKSALSNPWFRFFFCLSLSASLPVGISHRQMFHYISVSSPMYLLAMLYLAYPSFNRLFCYYKKHLNAKKGVYRVSTLLCLLSFGFLLVNAGGYNKNQALIEDVQRVSHMLGDDAVIIGSQRLMYEFDVVANFARYSKLSFLPKGAIDMYHYYAYFNDEPLPKGFKPLSLGLSSFKLAKRERQHKTT